MKRSISIALLVTALAMLLTIEAFAATTVDPPHYDAASGFVCITCHTAHLDLGSTGYNNICTSCHRPGDPAAGVRPITPGDAADPFGTYSVATRNISKKYQTSHRWDGSDTVPEAGAQPPLDPQMTANGLRDRTGGELACVRCHDQHSKANGNFLRMPNDQDQLCLDCHRSRNTQSSEFKGGSHPVGVTYQDKANANPAKFNAAPINVNPSNLSSAMNLIDGKVSCSTCHRVHFSDSRSGTTDGSANFANLSTGDGHLLRTDRRGAAVAAGNSDTMNICTNCHIQKNHNSAGQNIQCTDCHGAHVEHDPLDSATDPKNIHLVRRYLQYSSGQRINKRILFTSSTDYVNSAKTGVCESCHLLPANHYINNISGGTVDPGRVCNSCHTHAGASGAGAFSAGGDCSGCHGYPPVASIAGLGVAGNFENARVEDYAGGGGRHTVHLLATIKAREGFTPCLPCHPQSNHNQGNGTVRKTNVNVSDPGDTSMRFDASRTTRYNRELMQCSNISCHFQPTSSW